MLGAVPTVIAKPVLRAAAPGRSLPPWLEKLGQVLDNVFSIGKFRFGLDSLVGLVPGAGDWLTAVVGSVIIFSGLWQGLPKIVLARMVMYLGVDLLIGIVPFVGDFFDFVFQSNRMNLTLYREALAGNRRLHRDWWFVGLVTLALLALMAIPIFIVIRLWSFLSQFP